MVMLFKLAKVMSVKADIAKREITLSFVVDFGELATADELAGYQAPDAGTVVLEVIPRQMKLDGEPGL
jgi:hypothetical protein